MSEVVGILLAVLILVGVIVARVVAGTRERKTSKPGKLPGVYDSSEFRITGELYRDSGLPEIETIDDGNEKK